MSFLKQIVTWWNGTTIGTRFFTWRKGKHVGTDMFGNMYYISSSSQDNIKEKRWVIYRNMSDPTMVPPGWYGWLHHKTDALPSEKDQNPPAWQKPHLPNLTGTPYAYRPKGAIGSSGRTQPVTGEYEAWKPAPKAKDDV